MIDPRIDAVQAWLQREDGRLGDIFGLWTQGKRDDGWVADRLVTEGHLAALIEDAATPAPLDVERLARALTPYFGPSFWPGTNDVTILGGNPHDIAAAIAAAYADRPMRCLDCDATPASLDARHAALVAAATGVLAEVGWFTNDPEHPHWTWTSPQPDLWNALRRALALLEAEETP